jgi:hypothetical protein
MDSSLESELFEVVEHYLPSRPLIRNFALFQTAVPAKAR